MGLLERVREQRSAEARWPVGRVSEARWESQFGHHDDFSPAEYGDYIATSNDIYSVVNYRARHMGGLDLKVYRGRDEEKEHVPDGPVANLLRKVNPYWTFARLMRMTELSMGLWGESFWAAEGPGRGRVPRELWWLKSDRVTPVPDPDGYLQGFLYDSPTGEQLAFRTNEIVWFRYPNPIDEFAGLSPLAAAKLAADTSSAMMKSNRNLFANGLQIGGMVTPAKDKTTFSQEQADALEANLEKRFKGADKAHKWAVMRFDAQVQQMSVTPQDAEFVAGLNMTFRQVCRVYGVPSPLLYDLEHSTLANLRELQLQLWQDSLVPDANFYAADIEEQLLPMFRVGRGSSRQPDHVEWDFSRIPSLQESETATWQRERQQIEAGGITINEWRARHGMAPVPWGDHYWVQSAKVPVQQPEDAPYDNLGGGQQETPPGSPGRPSDDGSDDEGGQAVIDQLGRFQARLDDFIPVNGSHG